LRMAPPGPLTWFVPAQTLVALLVLVLSVWQCLDFATLEQRLGGPLASALVVLAYAAMTVYWPAPLALLAAPSRPRLITVGLILVPLTELGWALLEPDTPAPSLHRNVILLAALTTLAVVYSAGLGG